MKTLIKYASLVLLPGLFAVLPATLSAQPVEKVSISATAYAANGVPVDNNVTTKTKAPLSKTVVTANFIEQLVKDEFAEGNLDSDKVPSGAALAYNGTDFEIVKGYTVLVDVSDILTLTVTGKNDISGLGSYLDANGAGVPPFSQTDLYLATITYDDSASTGELTFSVTGLATVKQSATAPAKSGKYTTSGSISFSDGAGEGQFAGFGSLVLNAFTLTASGSQPFPPLTPVK